MFRRCALSVSLVLAVIATAASGRFAEHVAHRNRRETPSEGKHCPPLRSGHTNITCTLQDEEVPCNTDVEPGTIAKPKCDSYYKPSYDPGYTQLTCLDTGEWDHPLFHCTPECGSSSLDLTSDSTEKLRGAFPWHAGLYYREKKNGAVTWNHKCSGSLITDQFVITVAHCVVDRKENDLRVALGKYYRSWDKTEEGEERRRVTTIIHQRGFNQQMYAFDIALLRLNEKVDFGETIMPVCRGFPGGSTYLKNEELYVAGWGLKKDGNVDSESLLYNSVDVVNKDVCRKRFPSVYPAFDKFCTVQEESKVHPSDIGGGITSVYDGLHFIFGAVSAKKKEYTIFTNYTWPYNLIWIESEMRKYDSNFRWNENENEVAESENNDRGCLLPEASPSRKFCSMADGCKNCDTQDPLCFVSPGSKVDRVRVVCEPGYTLRSPYSGGDVAICMSGQWYPEIPECHKYRYVSGNPWNRVTWQEARDSCTDKGYQLATIKNYGENENFKKDVVEFFKTTGTSPAKLWIGLNDLKVERTFEWTDGSILTKSDFFNWQIGEPSDSDNLEHCVESAAECEHCFQWNDNYCSELNYYFCKEIIPPETVFDKIADFGDVSKDKIRYTYVPGDPWTKVTWDEARDNCLAKGSQLAIIRAPDQKTLFEEAAAKQFKDSDSSPSSIWIGLRSAKVEGKRLFNWVDGAIYNAWRPHIWNNWIVKKSNWNWDCTEAAAGDTLKLWPHASIYQWNDVNCTDENYYFCSVKNEL